MCTDLLFRDDRKKSVANVELVKGGCQCQFDVESLTTLIYYLQDFLCHNIGASLRRFEITKLSIKQKQG